MSFVCQYRFHARCAFSVIKTDLCLLFFDAIKLGFQYLLLLLIQIDQSHQHNDQEQTQKGNHAVPQLFRPVAQK